MEDSVFHCTQKLQDFKTHIYIYIEEKPSDFERWGKREALSCPRGEGGVGGPGGNLLHITLWIDLRKPLWIDLLKPLWVDLRKQCWVALIGQTRTFLILSLLIRLRNMLGPIKISDNYLTRQLSDRCSKAMGEK